MKSVSWSVCLSSLKKTSISHLVLYSSQIVLAAHFVLFVRNVISRLSPLTSTIARTRRNVCGYFPEVFAAVKRTISSEMTSPSRSPNGEDEPFCGTMRYRSEFSAVGVEERPAVIDLGKVCHSARVTLNGCELGCRFMPPYRFEVPRGVLRGRNELCVEVTSTGANRIRWNDRMGVRWKTFHDINMISVKGVWQGGVVPLDASDWPLVECGLLGPVILSCRRLR